MFLWVKSGKMNTRKILINSDHGGFGLTDEAFQLFLEKKRIAFSRQDRRDFILSKRKATFYVNDKIFSEYDIERDDPCLIETVEEIGLKEASDSFCCLKIVEIPIDVEWIISEYDGREWVAEKHRTWE